MSYELIICEKPSAAKNMANALADGKPILRNDKVVSYYEVTRGKTDIVVVSAIGHLYGLAQKDQKKKWTYPIFDIEGEVIGLNVVRYAAGQEDAKRMKFSTQTKPDLVKAYENASPHINWPQAEAGETRHMLDWFFGINLSRALTDSIKSAGAFKVMSTGRVQGPALKLIVDKEKQIQSFKSEPYWEISLLGHAQKDLTALHEKDIFWDEKEADNVMKKVKGIKTAIVSKVESKKFNQNPPFPFDLTSLQVEAYRLLYISPK